ncbi:hypothetical protein ACX3V1_26940 [Escherichia coli]
MKDGGKIEFTKDDLQITCLLYTSPSPRDISGSRMPLQADHGIRDPEMSRGLGDVYKRQAGRGAHARAL